MEKYSYILILTFIITILLLIGGGVIKENKQNIQQELKNNNLTVIKILDNMKDSQEIVIKDINDLSILYTGKVGDCKEKFFNLSIDYIMSTEDEEFCITLMTK